MWHPTKSSIPSGAALRPSADGRGTRRPSRHGSRHTCEGVYPAARVARTPHGKEVTSYSYLGNAPDVTLCSRSSALRMPLTNDRVATGPCGAPCVPPPAVLSPGRSSDSFS
jgi:hypothetical protein